MPATAVDGTHFPRPRVKPSFAQIRSRVCCAVVSEYFGINIHPLIVWAMALGGPGVPIPKDTLPTDWHCRATGRVWDSLRRNTRLVSPWFRHAPGNIGNMAWITGKRMGRDVRTTGENSLGPDCCTNRTGPSYQRSRHKKRRFLFRNNPENCSQISVQKCMHR